MNSFDFSQFHFLRPLWLWGCLPPLLLCYFLWRQKTHSGRWRRAIDENLLPHLLENIPGGPKRWPLAALLLAWLLACVAIAGPVWQKLPQPVRKKVDALVIMQDLSLSFYAQDLSPNRLTRALHKLGDLLLDRKEGTTGLVVYSGDAYVVAPLTDDTKTIEGMLSALSPEIMPGYGSNPVAAVEKALQLLKDTAVTQGRLLLITDGITETDLEEITDLVGKTHHTLSVLGVGTENGGPIPMQEGGFFKDAGGKMVVPKLDRAQLQKLATRNNGRYSDIQLTDQDLQYLLATDPLLPREENYRKVEREFDQWREQGAWLTLLILPLALLAFRRGWLLGFVLLISLWSTDSQAMNWQDLWQRPDQQAATALAQNNPQKAAELFQNRQWQGAARYRAGDYKGAAQSFKETQTATGQYNLGNALAKSGRLQEALAAYKQALKIDPTMADAKANQQLVEKVLAKQQQKQDQKQQDGKDGKEDKQQDKRQSQDDSQQAENKQQNQNDPNEKDRKQSASQANKQSASQNSDNQKPQPDSTAQAKDNSAQQPEQKADQAKNAKPGDKDQTKQQPPTAVDNETPLSDEQQQALQQWLRQVPDNPGGLLKRKFEYEYSKNKNQRTHRQEGPIW